MGQLHVPDGTWTLCSNGKRVVKIEVKSRKTIKIESGKIAATEEDRFDGNFVCPPMMGAGSLVGAVLAAALVVSGPALVVFAVGSVGAVAGGTTLVNHLPSIVSLLCHGSEWTALHSKITFEKKKALLQNATLSCMLGVPYTVDYVSFKIKDRRTTKRTTIQEVCLKPIRGYRGSQTLNSQSKQDNVFMFDQFAFSDKEVLLIEINENSGIRKQTLIVRISDFKNVIEIGTLTF